MTQRASVPAHVHQTILNASQSLSRAAVGVNGWTTWESACQAEAAISRAIEDLRSIKPNLRHIKQEIRRQEVKAANDRAIIARNEKREVMG